MKLRRARVLVRWLCVAVCVIAVSCSVSVNPLSTDDNATAGQGTLRVLVTDKPFPFEFIEEALVTITRVEVRGAESDDTGAEAADSDDGNGDTGEDDAGDDDAGSDNGTDDDAGNGDDGGAGDENGDGDVNGDNDTEDDTAFIVIFEGERSFDLLDLRNGRTDLLADAVVPAGTYTQMRLIVTEGQITLKGDGNNDGDNDDGEGDSNDENGPVLTLTVPSGSQSGIKLHFTFDVLDGEETVLLLDVDLSRAFTPIPGGHIEDVSSIETFHFTPSVAMRLIELLDAGTITGTVTDAQLNPLADVSVTGYADEEEVTTTSTDEDGTYTLGGLATGVYRLDFSATDYQEATIEDVAVNAGEVTENVDITMTPIAGDPPQPGDGGDGGE